jgi:hypothetical protein
VIVLLLYFLIQNENSFLINLRTFTLQFITTVAAIITIIMAASGIQRAYMPSEKPEDTSTNAMLIYSNGGLDSKELKKHLQRRFGKLDIIGADVFMLLMDEYYDEVFNFLSNQGEIRLIVYNMDSENPADFFDPNMAVPDQKLALLKAINDVRQNHKPRFLVYECFHPINLKGFAVNSNAYYRAVLEFSSSLNKKPWLYVNMKNSDDDKNVWRKEVFLYLSKARLVD